MKDVKAQLRAAFTNDVIRAIGALARQREVCREQDGKVVFVTGMDAAREYATEQTVIALLPVESAPSTPAVEVAAEALRRSGRRRLDWEQKHAIEAWSDGMLLAFLASAMLKGPSVAPAPPSVTKEKE